MKLMGGIFLFAFCFSCLLYAQEDRIQELQDRILKQQKILQDLEKKVEEKEKRSESYVQNLVDEYMNQPMAQDDGTGITAGYDKGFFIQAAEGDIKLKINGYLRYHLFLSEANTRQNNNFRASESRIDFHIYLLKDWHIRIRPDFSANGAIREAYLEYLGMDCMKFRIGTFIVPFSMQFETAPTELLAVPYTPYISAMMPQRDMGLMMFGNGIPCIDSEYLATHLAYSIGLFNGNGLNVGDNDDDKMFVGQLKFFPLGNKENVFLQGSVFINNTIFRENGAAINLWALQNHKVFEGGGDNDLDDTSGRSVGASGGFRYWKNNWRFEAEYMWMYANRTHDGANIPVSRNRLELWGASLGASYFIPVGEPKKNMGIEPLGRISYTTIEDRGGDGTASNSLNPLGTPTDITGQDVWEFIIGAKFHFNKHLRADFNWVMYDLKETGANLTNSSRGEGGGLLHAFVFQFMAKW